MAPNDAVKAKNMKVYISGFVGQHPIETGVAYWYRGHYLFGQAGNPVQPLLFPTKKEILIVGTTADTAPPYNEKDSNHVNERSVAALDKSKRHEWRDPPTEEEVEAYKAQMAFEARITAVDDERRAAEALAPSISYPQGMNMVRRGRRASRGEVLRELVASSECLFPPPFEHADPSVAGAAQQHPMDWRESAMAAMTNLQYMPGTSNEQFYNDGALYLAASAPGSRHGSSLASPYGSRSASPAIWPRGILSPIRSNPRLTQLLEEYGITRRGTPVVSFDSGQASPSPGSREYRQLTCHPVWMDEEAMNSFVDTVSGPPSRTPSTGPMVQGDTDSFARVPLPHSPLSSGVPSRVPSVNHMRDPGMVTYAGFAVNPTHSAGPSRSTSLPQSRSLSRVSSYQNIGKQPPSPSHIPNTNTGDMGVHAGVVMTKDPSVESTSNYVRTPDT